MKEQFEQNRQDTIKRTEEFILKQHQDKQTFLASFIEKNGKEPNEEQMIKIEAKFATSLAESVLDFLPKVKYIDPDSMTISLLEEKVFSIQNDFFKLGQTKSFMLLYKDSLDRVLDNPNINAEKYLKELFRLSSNEEFAKKIGDIIIAKKLPLQQILNDIIADKVYHLYVALFSHLKVDYFDDLVMRAIIADEKFFMLSIQSELFDFQFLELFVKASIQYGTVKHLQSIDKKYDFDYTSNNNELFLLAIDREYHDLINYLAHKDEVFNILSEFDISQLKINPEIKNHLISKKNFGGF